MASFVQCRGSIPLFWRQQTKTMKPKPDIECKLSVDQLVCLNDPLYVGTRFHIAELVEEHGSPLILLNLIK